MTERENQSEYISTQQILVATAHYTWEGATEELKTDVNLRKQQAQRTTTVLHDLQWKFGDLHLQWEAL